MTETNRIEYKRELTSELDVEKRGCGVVSRTHFRSLRIYVNIYPLAYS